LGIELTEDNHRAVFIPADLAHGFQTLLDLSEVFYQMSAPYHANSARGVRWNDPSFGIAWPILSPVLSLRDQHYPDFCP
jgi:dTDP-4-dehydrorhamnose 3,5-epimerase